MVCGDGKCSSLYCVESSKHDEHFGLESSHSNDSKHYLHNTVSHWSPETSNGGKMRRRLPPFLRPEQWAKVLKLGLRKALTTHLKIWLTAIKESVSLKSLVNSNVTIFYN